MKTAFQQWEDLLFPKEQEETNTIVSNLNTDNLDYLRGFNDALKLIKGEENFD